MDSIEQLRFQLLRLETLYEIKCKELAIVESKLVEETVKHAAMIKDFRLFGSCNTCLNKKGNDCLLGGCGPAHDKPDLWVWRGIEALPDYGQAGLPLRQGEFCPYCGAARVDKK